MAITKKVKRKEHENLTSSNIEKVIGLLEGPKPITKKDACEILNISYNTTRLAKIIEEYKHELELDKKRRAANRGKPASPYEIQTVIQNFLDGDTISEISSRLYRSPTFVNTIIDSVGLPERGKSYYDAPALPDACIADEFSYGQIVWSSRYNSMAIVLDKAKSSADYNVYHIYIIESMEETSPYFNISNYGGFHAAQAAFDLGSLEHLEQYSVDIYKPYRQYFPVWLKGR